MLTKTNDATYSASLIAKDPGMRAEVERNLPAVMAQLEPMNRKQMVLTLIRYAPAYGISDREQGEWETLFGIYFETLGELPMASLEDAFRRWNRNELYPDAPARHAFYPKPSELFTLAERHQQALKMAVYRAKKALEYEEEDRRRWTPEARAEEKRKAIAAGYLNEDGSLKLPTSKPSPLEDAPRPRQTPQQLARALRAAAGDPGDVL